MLSPAFLSLCCVYLLANLTVGSMPVIFGGFVDDGHVSLSTAGTFATAETSGLAVGSVLAIILIARLRISARILISASLVVCAAAQFLSAAGADGAVAVATIGARLVSGMATAVIQATAVAWISQRPGPARALTIFFSMAFLSGAVGIPLFTYLIGSVGLSRAFSIFAFMLLAALVFLPYMPRAVLSERDLPKEDVSRKGPQRRDKRHHFLLLAIAGNFIVNSGLWVYLERIGLWSGFDIGPVAGILSASMFAAMAAMLALGLAGQRAKAHFVIIFAHLALILATALLVRVGPWAGFSAAVIAFNVGVALLPPILLSTMANFDPSGRAGLQGLVAINIGYAIGPQAYSWLVSWFGMTASLLLTIVIFVSSLHLSLLGLGKGLAEQRQRAGVGVEPTDGRME